MVYTSLEWLVEVNIETSWLGVRRKVRVVIVQLFSSGERRITLGCLRS